MRTVVFLHIPKTGGVTLNSILYKQVNDDLIFEEVQWRWNEFFSLDEYTRSSYRYYTGHVRFGIHEHIPGDVKYITMMREPIERMISTYYYIRSRPSHEMHELSLRYSFKDFLKHYFEERENTEPQLRRVAGLPRGFPNSEITDFHLNQAIKNLQEHFLVAGLTERFDETIMLMKQALGWKPPLYAKKNVTKERTTADVLPDDVVQYASDNLKYEFRLYEYLNRQLDNEMEHHDSNYYKELQRFRQVNKLYQVYVNSILSTKDMLRPIVKPLIRGKQQ